MLLLLAICTKRVKTWKCGEDLCGSYVCLNSCFQLPIAPRYTNSTNKQYDYDLFSGSKTLSTAVVLTYIIVITNKY